MENKLNQKIGKCKKWVYDHLPEIVICGTTMVGVGAIYGCMKYANSIPVTVDDVTEVTHFPIPELKNEITMYDDRLDCWIPVVRKLTDEEFEEIKANLTENPDANLTGCLMVRNLLPDYLYG